MTDLIAWLGDVLDEEESGWRSQAWQEREGVAKPLFHFGQRLTDLLLADIEAKRAILEMHTGFHECPSQEDNCGWITDDHCATVQLLASAYAGRSGWADVAGPSASTAL